MPQVKMNDFNLDFGWNKLLLFLEMGINAQQKGINKSKWNKQTLRGQKNAWAINMLLEIEKYSTLSPTKQIA